MEIRVHPTYDEPNELANFLLIYSQNSTGLGCDGFVSRQIDTHRYYAYIAVSQCGNIRIATLII